MTNDTEYMREYMRRYNKAHRESYNEYQREHARLIRKQSVAYEGLMEWLESHGYEEAVRKGKELAK